MAKQNPRKPDAARYEKLGAFFLGSPLGPDGERTGEALLYDAKDLTTHAVCVGMTGSGKTGLCVTLLEEAALDGIPAIAIDPKGDLGNLMLTFPSLSPKEFRPWIDEAQAGRNGRTPEEEAEATATLWKKGLADWGQGPARIKEFRNAVDMAIYTPGSSAGRPLRVLKSFSAPPEALRGDAEAMRDRTQATVSGLLALLGIDPDPIKSREHILISTVLDRAWAAGRDLDLANLIREIQSPAFDRVGVFDLETFFPAEDRLGLAMTLNNLLASPGFASWMEGEPLDIQRLLYTEEGKPRLSILSIAHLSESERMFFVTLLLNEMVAWMRTQAGTQSLRALLYMDEVFGYFPPTANPPSKKPMLTLLKQARAYGVGCVLATQNPVDLDYKGLSNTGTWLLGRLQTERDKARVIEGLEGASATTGAVFDKGLVERQLAGLGSRQFMLNNVHEDGPVLFQTRWALSYLRGPLTREQIARLTPKPAAPKPKRKKAGKAKKAPAAAVAAEVAAPENERPVIPSGVSEGFLPLLRSAGDGRLIYRPSLVGQATVHYANSRANVEEWRTLGFQASLSEKISGSPWADALSVEPTSLELDSEAVPNAEFAELPAAALRVKSYPRWGKMLSGHVYKECALDLWKCAKPKATSDPGQTEGDFRAELATLQREKRDLMMEKLRKKYAPKIDRMQTRLMKADQKIEKEEEQYEASKRSTVISMGATMLSGLFGRKLFSGTSVGKATTAVRGVSRSMREKGDIERATEQRDDVAELLAELEQEFEAELEELRAEADQGDGPEIVAMPVRPRKSDTTIDHVTLVWAPWRVDRDGIAEPLWK